MSHRPLPESTRREDVPGRTVVLADGNAWVLAGPTVRYRLSVEATVDDLGRPGEREVLERAFGHPLEILAMFGRVVDLAASGSPSDQCNAFTDLAVALLTRAHDIDPATARELLSVPDEGLPGLVRAVTESMQASGRGAAHLLSVETIR